MSLLKPAILASINAMFLREGETVEYNDGDESTEVQAVRGELMHRGESVEGMQVLNQKFDWLIKSADLNAEPEVGHIIKATVGGVVRRYRVSNPTEGEDCFRWHDRWHHCYRIHTVDHGPDA